MPSTSPNRGYRSRQIRTRRSLMVAASKSLDFFKPVWGSRYCPEILRALVPESAASSNYRWPVARELRAFPKRPFRRRLCPRPPYQPHLWLPLRPYRLLPCPQQLCLQRYRPFLFDCRRPRCRARRAQPTQLETFSSHISLAAKIFRSFRKVGIGPLRRNLRPKSS